MESTYTIQQIEILSDIKAHTLRIWEKRYGIINPKRSDGNFRYFDDQELRKILNISFLNKSGIKISKIAKLSIEEIEKKVIEFYEESTPSLASFPILTKALIDYDIYTFNDFFKSYLKLNSFEKCLQEIVYPFFEKIGILWQTNKICPAQEHLFSQFIKQLVSGKINEVDVIPSKEKVLLYLRENEFHDIGLLVYQYLLKIKGYKIYNLGPSVPISNLVLAKEKIKPTYILTSFMAHIHGEEFQKYMRFLLESINLSSEEELILTGNHHLLDNHANEFPYHSIKSLEDFHQKFK